MVIFFCSNFKLISFSSSESVSLYAFFFQLICLGLCPAWARDLIGDWSKLNWTCSLAWTKINWWSYLIFSCFFLYGRSFVTLALTILTSSQAILIVWSKRAGKYDYSVTTANFSVRIVGVYWIGFDVAFCWKGSSYIICLIWWFLVCIKQKEPVKGIFPRMYAQLIFFFSFFCLFFILRIRWKL